ncbi:MAG: hypothetical protein M1839_001739 [Geoglossum umbratile]|nr:MAG: hypothetical protein M1839_001739 [Geoglossum umbratile]
MADMPGGTGNTGESAAKKFPCEKILAIPDLGEGGYHEDVSHVQSYLQHYGYFTKDAAPASGKLDTATCSGLRKFQQFYNIPKTGELDAATKQAIVEPRCGIADKVNSLDFVTIGPWDHRDIKYTFGKLSAKVSATVARGAVLQAFNTWAGAGVGLTFTEVGANESPDIRIEWRPAADPDHNMVGNVLAHADFPPPNSSIVTEPPLPLHFDDEEHFWVDGAVRNGIDLQTVALHEIGHCLGMLHSPLVRGAVMFPSVSSNHTLRVLSADDLEGIAQLYPPGEELSVNKEAEIGKKE